MKKIVATLIATGMLVGVGAVFAQSAGHGVTIVIPSAMMIRIVDGSPGNSSAAAPEVRFDIAQADYLALFTGDNMGGDLPSTSAPDFADVRVFSTANWGVKVTAATAGSWVGLDLSDISVRPTGTRNSSFVTFNGDWDLSEDGNLFVGPRTQGWRSLGFSGSDYWLTVNGEESGTYTATVTYTIGAP
jgi:hypothetical protein